MQASKEAKQFWIIRREGEDQMDHNVSSVCACICITCVRKEFRSQFETLLLWVITIEDLQEYDAMNANPTDLVLFSTAAQSHSRFSFSLTGSLKQVKSALSSFSPYNYVNIYRATGMTWYNLYKKLLFAIRANNRPKRIIYIVVILEELKVMFF